MNKFLTDLDIWIIILIIVLTLLKSIYNMYFLLSHENYNSTEERDIYIYYKKYPLFNIISLLTGLTYLFASIYFFMADKIKTPLFGAICLYMMWRSIGYFATVINVDMPGLSVSQENVYVYYNIQITSIIAILMSIYLLKLVFVG